MGKFYWYKMGRILMSLPFLYAGGNSGSGKKINYSWKSIHGAIIPGLQPQANFALNISYNPSENFFFKASPDTIDTASPDDYAPNCFDGVTTSFGTELERIDSKGNIVKTY